MSRASPQGAVISVFTTVAALTVLALSGLTFSGCGGEPGWKKPTYSKRDMARESGADTQFPGSLWDKLEKIGQGEAAPEAEGEGKAKGPGEGRGPKNHRFVEFAPLKAYLYEKTEGVLSEQALELDFGQGGGEIDLANHLSGRRGSFYLAAEIPEELADAELKVYFLGSVVAKELAGHVYGTGCNAYYDVTSYFAKAMNGPGILVNTADARHALALGGTLFFAYAKGAKLKLTRLTLKDSRAGTTACSVARSESHRAGHKAGHKSDHAENHSEESAESGPTAKKDKQSTAHESP